MIHSPSTLGGSPAPGVLRLARREWPSFLAAGACLILAALATAGFAALIGPILRALFGAGPVPVAGWSGLLAPLLSHPWLHDAVTLAVILVLVATVKGASGLGETLLAARAAGRLASWLRLSAHTGLLAMSPLDPLVRRRGELAARLTQDVAAVETAVTTGAAALLRHLAELVALAGLCLMLDPWLGAVGLVAFPPVAVVILRLGRRLRQRRRRADDAAAALGLLAEESAALLPAVRFFGADALLAARFARHSEHARRRQLAALVTRAVSSPFNEILGAAALGLTIVFAQHRIASGELAPEAFVSFFAALFLLYQPVKGLGLAWHALAAGEAALERLAPLLAAGPGDEPTAVTAPLPASVSIALCDVHAGYGQGPEVLAGIDLDLVAGQRLALLGPSGAGKTTLLHVLTGVLEPRRGELRVDGERRALTLTLARRLFAPVPQEPELFDETVGFNVRIGRPEASDDEVLAACRQTGVLDFATPADRVGPGGRTLSVGQRQRVCLARALVSRAPVLLFDEPTAALDGQGERQLVDELARCLAGRTVLVITHRPGTARLADEVALLEAGRIVARGPLSRLETDPRFQRSLGRAPDQGGPS